MEQLRPREAETLRPGDIVQLQIWSEPDLPAEYMVDQFGNVILPRVGKWAVSEETEASLEARLATALGEELRNTDIDVTVLRRIHVLGAVEEPGLYPLDTTMRLADAVAQAGGVNPTGQRNRIDLIREWQRYVIELDKHAELANLPLRSGDSVFVPQTNWFIRNYAAVLTGASSLAGLVAVIISATN